MRIDFAYEVRVRGERKDERERVDREDAGFGTVIRTWRGVHDADARQTHLPTTIAGGCAGFLSRDERANGARSIPGESGDLLLHGNAKKEDRCSSRIEETVKNARPHLGRAGGPETALRF